MSLSPVSDYLSGRDRIPGEEARELVRVATDTIREMDAANGPVTVGTAATLLISVPFGAVYLVRLWNNNAADVFLSIGSLATLNGFPLSPGEKWEGRISGGLKLCAISAAGGAEVRVWANAIL